MQLGFDTNSVCCEHLQWKQRWCLLKKLSPVAGKFSDYCRFSCALGDFVLNFLSYYLSYYWTFEAIFWKLVSVTSICHYSFAFSARAFSALMLLVWQQEGHPARKTWVVGCWHVYLSGARCDLRTAQLWLFDTLFEKHKKLRFFKPVKICILELWLLFRCVCARLSSPVHV